MRATVNKTAKLFIGGAFVRSESGLSQPALDAKGNVLAQAALASRKDLRDAVVAARGATHGWASRTAYNRGQVIYRMAEMLEARASEFANLIQREAGVSPKNAAGEVTRSIDGLIYYAGWSDKFAQVVGSVNPVSGPFFNFSFPEPTGVVGLWIDPCAPLAPLILQTVPALVTGNTTVLICTRHSLTATLLAEIIATSDVPAGVVNILTGKADLLPHMAGHMDVNALGLAGLDAAQAELVTERAALNLKRIHFEPTNSRAEWLGWSSQGLGCMEPFVEIKTVWHPVAF